MDIPPLLCLLMMTHDLQVRDNPLFSMEGRGLLHGLGAATEGEAGKLSSPTDPVGLPGAATDQAQRCSSSSGDPSSPQAAQRQSPERQNAIDSPQVDRHAAPRKSGSKVLPASLLASLPRPIPHLSQHDSGLNPLAASASSEVDGWG